MEAIILILIVVFGVGIALANWKHEEAKRWYDRFDFWRRVLGAVILIFLAATFIQSGNPILIGLTFVLIFLAGLYVAVEQPHRTLV